MMMEEPAESAICGTCHTSATGVWVCCETCHTWYHMRCVPIRRATLDNLTHWCCYNCMPKIVLMYLSSTASKACKATQCTAACQADVSVQAVCDEHVDNSMQIDHPVKIDVPTQTEDLSCTAGKASKATQCTAVCQADVSVQTVHDEHVDPVIEDVPTQTDCHLDLSTKVQCNQHHASELGHENVQSVAQAIHICEAPVFVQTSDVNGQMSSPSEPEDIHAHGQASLPADEVDLFLMPEDIHANQDSQSDDKDEWFPLSSIVPNIFTPNLKKRKKPSRLSLKKDS